MSIKLYGLAKCSTCIKARTWLDAQGVSHAFQDYRDTPVAPATLKTWAESLGGWEKLVNRKGTTWRGLDEATRNAVVNNASARTLLRAHASVIKRPVVEWADGAITVGFDDGAWSTRI